MIRTVTQDRETEILLRFVVRLATLEITGSLAQRQAARQALLLEQAYSLAAIRALAAAERRAAREVTGRSALHLPNRPSVGVSTRKRRQRGRRRSKLLVLRP